MPALGESFLNVAWLENLKYGRRHHFGDHCGLRLSFYISAPVNLSIEMALSSEQIALAGPIDVSSSVLKSIFLEEKIWQPEEWLLENCAIIFY